MIKHGDWSEVEGLTNEVKNRWEKMTKIDDELKIYSDIKDLNSEDDIRKEYIDGGKTEEEVKNQIEYDVDFLGYVWFSKNSEIIEIKEAEMFEEGGATTKIDEINSLE